MVKTAVGFDENRGDRMNVTVIPFDFEIKNRFNTQLEQEEKWEKYRIIAALFIIVALITSLGAYVLFRKLEHRRLREREAKAMEDLLPQLDEIDLEEELSVEEQERVDQENQIKQIALQKPEEVATLVRNWMAED
jgi:flagellar M-ring protein FliF